MKKAVKSSPTALLWHDMAFWEQGLAIAGIDEAGRGPLAGPVVAGCVVLPPAILIHGVNDSKQLTPAARERLYAQILDTAVFAQTGLATVEEIEALNILQATKLAMARAGAGAPCGIYLLDAMEGVDLPRPQRSIVHGDATSYHIAAASILAKVTRDHLMDTLAVQYAGYGLERHKGYGTAEHIAAIRRLGPCPIHRKSFLRNIC
jgi:ribonuclease HII